MTSVMELMGDKVYSGYEILSLRELKEIFPSNKADEYNWLFLSQKCFHGDDRTLDQIESILLEGKYAKPLDGKWPVTILVVHPRLCTLKWGYIEIRLEDIEWLRGVVRSTLEIVRESQNGNT